MDLNKIGFLGFSIGLILAFCVTNTNGQGFKLSVHKIKADTTIEGVAGSFICVNLTNTGFNYPIDTADPQSDNTFYFLVADIFFNGRAINPTPNTSLYIGKTNNAILQRRFNNIEFRTASKIGLFLPSYALQFPVGVFEISLNFRLHQFIRPENFYEINPLIAQIDSGDTFTNIPLTGATDLTIPFRKQKMSSLRFSVANLSVSESNFYNLPWDDDADYKKTRHLPDIYLMIAISVLGQVDVLYKSEVMQNTISTRFKKLCPPIFITTTDALELIVLDDDMYPEPDEIIGEIIKTSSALVYARKNKKVLSAGKIEHLKFRKVKFKL